MSKEVLEIKVNKNTDSFEVSTFLNSFRGIKAAVVTTDTVRVRFDPEKIEGKRILKLISQAGRKPGSRTRKANVISVKQMTDEPKLTA
jgi:hypothetical protein